MPESVWWHSSGWMLIFLVVAGSIGFVTGAIKSVFPKVNREKERLNSINEAREISLCSHRVINVSVYPGMIWINIRADNDTMEEGVLWFSHKHPDFEDLALVKKLDILQFNFQELPIDNVEKQDLIAYLRLKH